MMNTDSITRKWQAGAELAQQLNREFDADKHRSIKRATRPPLEVERCLVICRACPHFTGNDCAELQRHPAGFQATGDGDPVSPPFAALLTRREFICRRWSAGYQEARGVSEEGLARLHRQGIRRTPDEHRAARREGRRRRR